MSSFPSCDMTYSGLRSVKASLIYYNCDILIDNLKIVSAVKMKIAHLKLQWILPFYLNIWWLMMKIYFL